MSTTPVTLYLSISARRAREADQLSITCYAAPQGSTYGSTWTRQLPMYTTSRDEPTARLRAAALAILEATGGLPDLAEV